MPIKSLKEAKEIVKFVEGDDGLPRLDNMIREDRYAEAKISLAAMDFPEIKALVEILEVYVNKDECVNTPDAPDWKPGNHGGCKWCAGQLALSNFNRALGKES